MAVLQSPRLLLDGLRFAEAPRWHEGRLWFADMVGRNISAVDIDGNREVVAEFDDECCGLGFMPDGSMLVVLRTTKQVVRVDQGSVALHCDLGDFPCPTLNDMVVDARGRAYVGAFVSRPEPSTDDRGEALILLDESGSVRDVTRGLINPNGGVIAPSGDQLILAETRLHQLTKFRVQPDGKLVDRDVFAPTGAAAPDGICLDAEGAVWIGSPNGRRFLRIAPGGEVLDAIETPTAWTVACALGGADRRTLFLLTLAGEWATLRQPGGAFSRIETVTVAVPGAGRS